MIKTDGLSFKYATGTDEGIYDINLNIQRGECVLLCGPSGCGKTTLIRMINGLIPKFFNGTMSGNMTVKDKDVKELQSYEISEIVGSVFQNPKTQFFNVDTDSEIVFGLENMAVPQKNIMQRLDKTVRRLNIEKLTGRNIFKLSGGEKQKIAFASVYAMEPEIFVLDEPSSNLDIKAINELGDYLCKAKAEGKTLVIAEHRLYYLMDIVDRILYMKDGRIVHEYTREEFIKIKPDELKRMGLRTTNIDNIEYPSVEYQTKYPDDILEIRNISVYQKKYPVLENVNVKFQGGEIIAITGENGVGKTTFSRAVIGLHNKIGGEIYLNGKKTDIKQRQRMSYMVMQDVNYQLFAESVEAECSFGLENISQEDVDRVLKEMELYRKKSVHPNLLSGGQKQRLAVAVSVLCNKKVIVFDEPTSGLDYESMRRVGELMKRLAEQGKIIIVVTHDRELMAECCSRLIILKDGRVSADIPVVEKNKNRINSIEGE